MALFAITGLLSFSAGLGIGALLPVDSKVTVSTVSTVSKVTPTSETSVKTEQQQQAYLMGGNGVVKPHVALHNPKQSVSQRVSKEKKATEKAFQVRVPKTTNAPKTTTPLLDFTDFDQSLINMLDNPKAEFSTIRPSVAKVSNYYTPPSAYPENVQPPTYVTSPSYIRKPPSNPSPSHLPHPPPELQGGAVPRATQRTKPNIGTSWF
jgi:hypothetical protein